ncbi:MAG: type II toxin-antitoxin system YafQ family toxin [Bacteroidales bacterium]|nr:type II toxin-antitoxin system YafQ family toxin [Bacteroidales bacterium]
MAYTVTITSTFKKDFKRCMKRGMDMSLITKAMDILEESGTLPQEYYPHRLKGDHKGQWKCHIQSDWLMTWEQDDKVLTLLFLETGTHSDLFG